ncbi:helix-turn-helix domain-containing protein [Fluviispira multicolorata]|uniref:Helix-turn-helix domain-containing protein n=1 Tax=Fluviispira multicolorata TaxID=2654512 RepID=A0A833JB28_9BACT|nr:helix-turn-helix domain-containing protein [Fluviispira multicolorata]KAB8027395.1 helix-turn-helix domain-containing protein [Fluviispira multicolorata]
MSRNIETDKSDSFGQYIAIHMKSFRREYGLSQEQLSERSGIPRSTIASLERGEGNPTLQVLVGIAQGLGVEMSSLLKKPVPTAVLRKKKDYTKVTKKLIETGEVLTKTVDIALLTPENSRYLILQEYILNEGERFPGSPHSPGTEEYFYCQTGSFEIMVESEYFVVEEGDLLCFDGHQKHAYACCLGFKYSKGLSIVVQVPKF